MTTVTAGGAFLCGPAKGTKVKPYRCICCEVAFKDYDALGVSMCWNCIGGNTHCKRCRRRGVFVSDFRIGTHWDKDGNILPEYDPQGGLGHRLRSFRGSVGVMRCGKTIPIKHFGSGEAVVPPCPRCWRAPSTGDERK